MLKQILSITGRPGLFKILSQGKNMILVEDLQSHKRLPAYSRDKIVSLGDIAIYTNAEEVPLSQVLQKVYEHTNGEKIDNKALIAERRLRDEFALILPDFDRDRVYDNDIKKLFAWFNILIDAGFTTFVEAEEDAETPQEESAEAEAETEAK